MAAKTTKNSMNVSGREIVSTRVFAAPRERVFKAFSDPQQLAHWWGPQGFTNTFREFDLRPGGHWRLAMRAPNGAEFHNESQFVEVAPPGRIVFRHLEPVHRFQMTMIFAAQGGKTKLTWRMLFESADECARVKKIIVEANEQNFDRLEAHLAAAVPAQVTASKSSAAAGDTAGREIVLSRVFDAPRELVWEVWTNPKHVANWWGPRGFSTKIEKMDVRPGGVWKHVMRGPDGVEYANKSVFKEIVKPERIVMSHGGARKGGRGVRFIATWTFEAQGARKTKVTLRSVFPSAEARDRVIREFDAVEGGKQTLVRLGEYLAVR